MGIHTNARVKLQQSAVSFGRPSFEFPRIALLTFSQSGHLQSFSNRLIWDLCRNVQRSTPGMVTNSFANYSGGQLGSLVGTHAVWLDDVRVGRQAG
jgi:hypothetical protein